MENNAEETVVSIRQFAKIVNCSHTQIWRLIQSGVIPQRGDGIPIPAAVDAFTEYQKTKKRGKANLGGASDFDRQMLEAEYRLIQVKANIAELEYKKRAGILIDTTVAERIAADTATELRQKLFAMPARFAGILETKTAAEIEKILANELEKMVDDVFKRGFIALGFSADDWEKYSKQPQEWTALERLVKDLPESKKYIDSIPLEERTPEKALQIAAELEKAAGEFAEKSLADK